MKKLDKTKLVKEMARDRIGQPKPTRRRESSNDLEKFYRGVCPDCNQKLEACTCGE